MEMALELVPIAQKTIQQRYFPRQYRAARSLGTQAFVLLTKTDSLWILGLDRSSKCAWVEATDLTGMGRRIAPLGQCPRPNELGTSPVQWAWDLAQGPTGRGLCSYNNPP